MNLSPSEGLSEATISSWFKLTYQDHRIRNDATSHATWHLPVGTKFELHEANTI